MKFILCFLLALSLTGCGYQGWVRYPCQEFENWQNAECREVVPGMRANKVKFSSYRYNLRSGIEWINLIGGVNLKVDGHVRLFQEAR